MTNNRRKYFAVTINKFENKIGGPINLILPIN